MWKRLVALFVLSAALVTVRPEAAGAFPFGGQPILVQLTAMNNRETIVLNEAGNLVTPSVSGTFKAMRATRIDTNRFRIDAANDCGGGAGGWRTVAANVPGPVVFTSASGGDAAEELVSVCAPTATRAYRGVIEAIDHEFTQYTVNRVGLEDYLRGVVPRESPASWGDLGGGRGMEALKAQAVAARSYAWAEDRDGPWKTCDTTSCQVYLGKASRNADGTWTALEDARTDRAISETAGQVRVFANGAVARTEFSSSTGGYTAGGVFPAVPDEGDTHPLNPNHDWTADVGFDAIVAKYPSRGDFTGAEVTQRNGLGAEGGRVLSMRLTFADGSSVTSTGDAFRSNFGLKSDWFSVVTVDTVARQLRLSGHGWGHGRGMGQYGALGYAVTHGWDYRRILGHFYSNTNEATLAPFGYHVVTRDGGVFTFGGAEFHGSLPGLGIRTAVKDIAEGPDGGYWLMGEDGGVFSFDVPFYGSMGGQRLNRPVVGMAPTPDLQGYWLVANDGGIFSFGNATFHGSTGDIRLNQPVVGMGPTPKGDGYWLVATDGGIFSFGQGADFYGSTGDIRLNQPVFAMAPTPSGKGYWLVARDGGIFTFGDATYLGSLPERKVAETAVELLPSQTGNGYLIVTAEGRVHGFGDAVGVGGPADHGARAPAVGAGIVIP